MDKIYECANNFNNMLKTKYVFTIVSSRKQKTIVLDFLKEDYRHAAGLHHVDDISLENNPSKLVDSIINGCLTDEILEKSTKYTKPRREGGTIKERVSELCYLEEYIDKSDIIRIFKVQDFRSSIEADYFIEASSFNRHSTVYIFIRKRTENDNYVVVSFFKKSIVYQGGKAYWMLKEKIVNDTCITLYKHPNYNKPQ